MTVAASPVDAEQDARPRALSETRRYRLSSGRTLQRGQAGLVLFPEIIPAFTNHEKEPDTLFGIVAGLFIRVMPLQVSESKITESLQPLTNNRAGPSLHN